MFARFFIDRPIFAWVLSLVIILIGGVAIIFLPITQYPPITPPTIQVTASYPGANAQVVADVIAAPIEEQVNGVENMMYMSSQSTNDGNYALTVTFEIGTDLDTAQVLVQNRVALAIPQMPAQVQLQGINTKKRSPDILLAVSLFSPDERFDELYLSNYATIHIQDELARIKGVGDILIFGQRSYSMRIWLDPYELATRDLTAVDVVNAIQNQNVQVAAGQVGQQPVPVGQQLQLPMSALGRLETVKQFGDIILKTGAPTTTSTAGQTTPSPDITATPVVRVRDVADIEMGAQTYDQSSKLDGQPSAGIGIFLLPGANALNVADAIKARMVELKADFPEGLDYGILYDTTPFIRRSVDEVFRTLLEAIVLVALVVLFFLQDWKAMILPMIDVPVSLVGTCAVMAVLGFSLNNLTLFGLVLAIGIVVDDAIVVLENIERLIATGLDARAATIKAMDEITGPIVAITLVLSSVFLPSIFVPGLTGQFYRQFAVTIASAMIISAINAMTLTPARAVSIFKTEERTSLPAGERRRGEGAEGHELQREALPWWFFGIVGGVLAWWLALTYLPGRWGLPASTEAMPRSQYWTLSAAALVPGALLGGLIGWFIIHPVNAALGWFFRGFNRVFDRMTAMYGWTVSRSLRLSAIVLVVYVALLVLTVWRVASAPTSLIPNQDQGYLLVNAQLPDSASVQRTEEIMEHIDKIARGTPGVAHTVGVSGQSFLLGTNGSNLGSMFVVLAPFPDRKSPAEYDAAIASKIQAQCARDIEGAIVTVFRAPPIRGLGNVGGFQLQTEQRGYVDLQELQAMTDRLVEKANANPAFAGVFSQFRAATPQLFVDIDRAKVQSLQVPIQDVFTTLQVDMGGLYVNQFNKFGRTWQVQVQAAPRFRTTAEPLKQFQVRNSQGQMVPLGTLAQVRPSSGPLLVMRYNMYASAPVNGMPAPGVSSGTVIQEMTRLGREADVRFEWTALSYLEVQAGNVALLIFALGTALVYFVLAAKYESWRLPLAVILVVPLCMLAAVTGMTVARLPVDIFVQIGLLVLVGMASKNAILIVEYARQLHDEGKELHEAALEASRIRFRPIIMTSLAFIFGVLPLVLATGAGAEMRRSLGTAVFAGMIGVTLFGVFLTPVFYFVIQWLGARRRPPTALASEGTRAPSEAIRRRGNH
jgi:multidrug efflux pump